MVALLDEPNIRVEPDAVIRHTVSCRFIGRAAHAGRYAL